MAGHSSSRSPSISKDDAVASMVERHEDPTGRVPKTNKKGVVLVPQPTDDPNDPLNWPLWQKCLHLGIFTAASFAGASVGLTNSAGFAAQGELYGVTLIEMSYGVSATVAGLAAGPFVWAPLSRWLGRSALIFWGMLLLLATTVWGAECTGRGDYISFILSRLFGALVGSVATTIGAGLIFDIFFLHQRGKAFTCYSVMFLVGTVAAPTFSGFIVTSSTWPVQFWYHVALEGVIAILAFFCLYETNFTRSAEIIVPDQPRGYWRNRLDTIFFPWRLQPRQTASKIAFYAIAQFRITVTPVALCCGFYLFVSFGWAVANNTLLGVYLQTPIEEGGYGFNPLQNAEFLFTSWIAVAAAQVYGQLIADRFPIWICKRFHGGVWKPEYRLHSLWLPGLILQPIGLGVFGLSLHVHLAPGILALGAFLLTSSAIVAVPIVDNYITECFTTLSPEANTSMNFYRTLFGICIPFFIDPWLAAVGVNWVFGMMAFFSIFAFAFIVLVMVYGHSFRQMSTIAHDEEGTKLAPVESKVEA